MDSVLEIMVYIALLVFLIFGLVIGYKVGQPTQQQTEILNRACEYIYENEPLEVYTQYCK